MYKIYISEAKMKDIFCDEYSNIINFTVDSLDEANQIVLYFIEKGFTVFIEPTKEGE